MRWAINIALLLLALGLVGGVMAVGSTDTAGPSPELIFQTNDGPPELGLADCAAEVPDDFSDPDEDVLGWYDGYWYAEPIDVDTDGGLTEEELDMVVARSKARWEALRCLPVKEDVEVEVIDRETFQEEHAGSEVSDETRLFENAVAKGLFLVGQDEDAVAVQEANRGQTVGGFYSVSEEKIVLVSGADGELHVNEPILGHEIGHAVQDQHFGLDGFAGTTTDGHQANLGLIEGDVSFVDWAYEEHCESGAWAGDCVMPPESPGFPDLANVGLYYLTIQPYSDGPNFIAEIYADGGWEAVNAIYDEYPSSAKEVMYPQLYPEFTPDHPEFADRSTDDWRLLEHSSGEAYDHLGEPALFMSLLHTDIEGFSSGIIDAQSFVNQLPGGEPDPTNPFNYSHEYTDGWVGDRFLAFAEAETDLDDDPALAYQLEVAFEDSAEAATFEAAWTQLLEFREATPLDDVETEASVFKINDTGQFDGVYWMDQDGDVVTVVYAPTLDELAEVNTELDVGAGTPTPSPEGIPGFGVTVAIFALVSAFGYVVLRRR